MTGHSTLPQYLIVRTGQFASADAAGSFQIFERHHDGYYLVCPTFSNGPVRLDDAKRRLFSLTFDEAVKEESDHEAVARQLQSAKDVVQQALALLDHVDIARAHGDPADLEYRKQLRAALESV